MLAKIIKKTQQRRGK